jgi:hypothetical protein
MRQGPQTVRTIFGLLLTGLGVLFLVDSLGVYRLDYSAFWPVFPLGVGLSFLAVHLLDRTPATRWALIPGCLVTVVGLILFLIAFRLADLSLFWPVFPFGVGLAFLLMYALGIRERSWPLCPGCGLLRQ